ncbi:PQQ-dependent sugar dehydrogenase [soil metagenome]
MVTAPPIRSQHRRSPWPRHRRSSRPRLIAGFAAVAVATTGLASCRVAPETLSTSVVVGNLAQPWDLGFTPAGGIVFTEKVGRVRVRTSRGELRTLAAPGDVVVRSEGGMMGLAMDPNFSANRRLYVCFQSNAGGGTDVRVVRYRLNQAGTGLHDRADIVTGIPAGSGRHTGCRPRFGPDGNLWIGTGDAATGSVPQAPKSLGGKVLRVDTNGRAVPGNAPAPFDPRIYTYGHRNVQGLAFSPGGQAYAIEHGPAVDDEVNRLVAGGNYGWDPRPLGGGSAYDESRPMTDTQRHPNARAAVWRSGSSTIAPSGATFLTGNQWSGWDGVLAMAVLKGRQVRVLGLDGSGSSVTQEWTEITDRGRLRSAVQGPDGNLYLATDANPGAILRVTPG